jgi:enediyne biosynthesis protein E4
MAGGIAAFGYNGNGLADIFFTNGAAIPSLPEESPR